MSYAILAGEQSGEQLGAKLVQRLGGSCFGMGEALMEAAGVELIARPLHVMGISDVVRSLPKILAQLKSVKKALLQRKPKAVITIDNPDFSLRLARDLRKAGFTGKLIHFVSPSVWAWRASRVYQLEKLFDHLFTLLPFEKAYYEKTSLAVTYIGHPLLQFIKEHNYQPLDLPDATIALFPGSRTSEIVRNLPLQIEATKGFPIAISVARAELAPLISSLSDAPLIAADRRYDLMKQAKLALATSGTIALELALHQTPTLITYQLTALNYFIARHIFKIHLPFYSLPNLICGREIFPEFIHKKISPLEMKKMVQRLCTNPEICLSECGRIQELLDEGDSFKRAAEVIKNL